MRGMILIDDFNALMLAKGCREVALEDALLCYENYALADESVNSFYERFMKSERPHMFTVPTRAADDAPELFSIDAQGRFAKEHGAAALGDLLARHNLKVGQTKKLVKEDPTEIKGETNPYSPNWKGTEEARQAKIASLLKLNGTRFVATLAKSAGKTITNTPLPKK